jgi:molybdopterin biosynthesis enzyme
LALQGVADPLPRFEPGTLAAAVKRNPARDELMRARRAPSPDGAAVELEPVVGQESHMIARSATADVLVLVPRGDGELEPGSRVRYLRLS